MDFVRSYFLDENGRILGIRALETATVSAAVNLGTKLAEGFHRCDSIEIWRGGERLHTASTARVRPIRPPARSIEMNLEALMRCYLFRNGHIAAVETLNAGSDGAVIEQARVVFENVKSDYEGFEVWDRARVVYRYPELPKGYVTARTEAETFYRLYLRGEGGTLQGTFDFSADSDEAAYEIGEIAFDGCSDRAVDFEVRHGSRRINLKLPALMTNLEQVMAHRQAQVVALEERMRDSRWVVAKSERLLARLKDLKALRGSADERETSPQTQAVE